MTPVESFQTKAAALNAAFFAKQPRRRGGRGRRRSRLDPRLTLPLAKVIDAVRMFQGAGMMCEVKDIALFTGLNEATTRTCVSKLRRRGIVVTPAFSWQGLKLKPELVAP